MSSSEVTFEDALAAIVDIDRSLKSIDESLLVIARAFSGKAIRFRVAFKTKFSTGDNMALTLPDDQQDSFFIIGIDGQGISGASLAAGQTCSVFSEDPSTVAIALDATPGKAPDGTQSVASGTVKSATPPAKPNTPINLTATVTNQDGSVAETVTDTVTITPGAAVKLGEVFGTSKPVSGS